MLDRMRIRDATGDDWPAIWRFMRPIVAAGETYTWDRDISEERARGIWMRSPPGRTLVAVDTDGAVLGTATYYPNQGGPGSHIANGSFMVDPDRAGRGVGRALGERVIEQAGRDGFAAMQFNAVVETNTRAVKLWLSLGFAILATVPEAFRHPDRGDVGLHIMYRRL